MSIKFGSSALKKITYEVNKNNTKQVIRLFVTSNIEKKCKKVNNKSRNAPIKERKIESVSASLSSKGFLRSLKSYTPPGEVANKIKNIFNSFKLPTNVNYSFKSLEEKYNVLNACFKDLNHGVSNSTLYEMKTMDDVIRYYETRVDTTVPLDAMKNIELPPNLHVQYDYLRFQPENNAMFKGQTAFPKSSTLVTGLKYRKKYPGYIVKSSWP